VRVRRITLVVLGAVPFVCEWNPGRDTRVRWVGPMTRAPCSMPLLDAAPFVLPERAHEARVRIAEKSARGSITP
jgi:hypothetical protein